jgi:hypothetical protein
MFLLSPTTRRTPTSSSETSAPGPSSSRTKAVVCSCTWWAHAWRPAQSWTPELSSYVRGSGEVCLCLLCLCAFVPLCRHLWAIFVDVPLHVCVRGGGGGGASCTGAGGVGEWGWLMFACERAPLHLNVSRRGVPASRPPYPSLSAELRCKGGKRSCCCSRSCGRCGRCSL